MAFCHFCYSVEVFPTLVGMNRGEGDHECGGLGALTPMRMSRTGSGHLWQRHLTGFRRGGEISMRLTADEQAWLDAYRQILKGQYPGIVERMIIYGSKARGDDHPDSDLDVLLIVKNEAAHLKRQLRRIGYELAATSDAVPSILAYTQDEWETRRKHGSPFQQAVERDAVPVL